MANIQEAIVPINFQNGVNTKTDEKQVRIGQFISLVNSVFDTEGMFKKRNGYGLTTTIPDATTITTYSDNLVALSPSSLTLHSSGKNINTGFFQPMSLSVLPMVRRATGQTTVDTVIAPNGLACSAWLDGDGKSYYQINDSVTGGTIIPSVSITNGVDTLATMPRVFVLGRYFIVTFISTISVTNTLRYIAIPFADPGSPLAAVTISSQVESLSAAYDGIVAQLDPDILYIAWAGSDIGGAIRIRTLSASLLQNTVVVVPTTPSNLISTAWDTVTNQLWVTYYTLATNTIKTLVYNQSVTNVLAATTVVSSVTLHNGLTTTAYSGTMNVFYEVSNFYTFDGALRTDYVSKNTCTNLGVVGTPSILKRGVGLGSKAVYLPNMGKSYLFLVYGSAYQPTYFLIDSLGNLIGKCAYENGGGYIINQILPQINVSTNSDGMSVLKTGYLFKDFLASIASPVGPLGSNVGTNKTIGAANTVPIYTQTGINMSTFTFNSKVPIAETGGILHMGAGFPWMFDGVKPVEHQFHLWPDAVEVTTATGSGGLVAQQYYYQWIYYWIDGQGNPQYSAPSVPVGIVTTTSSSTNTVYVPTLRLTEKTSNKVILKGYRWSTAQQVFYEVTSVQNPTLNDPSVDYITFVDTKSDAQILGNSIIYTNGGVLEDVAAPSFSVCTMFDDRVWALDAEDGSIWYSKQILPGTGVEFSDLLTYYVAPTQGAQGSTGLPTALCPMDTSLVVFKKDAMYYINGSGPDNTGAGGQYTQPIFISSTVGCSNPNSIVLMDLGIMFQSDKGIWLLGRNLQPNYIGAAVERFVLGNNITSAQVIPETTQIRFTVDTGITLMYDYFYNQWGTFSNTPAISATLYQGLHTYLNKYGQVLQETPGRYLDISTPVLLSFLTSNIQLQGLSGYQRLWEIQLLGSYISPHLLDVRLGYNFGPVSEQAVIQPTNHTNVYGGDELYGQTSPYGGPGSLEQWRIQQSTQVCQSFQISVNEVYDPSFGDMAGAGFTMSSLTCVIGVLRGYRPLRAANTAGTN